MQTLNKNKNAVINWLKTFRARYPRILLTLVTLALLLPFAGKAFHIDDPLFVWTGHHMRTHPFDPYGFDVNWYGTAMRMADVTKNPPLACAYIALLSSIFGEREFWLHVGFLAQAVAVILGTYTLAQRFCQRPFYAALATLLTPVFLVSSTTLMCDVLMLALWLWATVWWLRGLDRNEPFSFVLAGLLLAACGLAKYFGLALLPLLLLYSFVKTRRAGWWLACFLIPIVVFALYECWTRSLYGKGLLLDAVSYSGQVRSHQITPIVEFLTALGFTGGCFAIVLIFTPFIWARKLWIGGAVCLLLFAMIIRSPLPFAVHLQWNVMIAGGIAVISLALLDFSRQRNAGSVMLLSWVLGTFAFCFCNWTINGRILLPMAPAVAILLWRRVENTTQSKERRYLSLGFVAAATISLLVARADYQLANTARTAAAEIGQVIDKLSPSMTWFQGHWGFQYYAQVQGLSPFDMQYSRIERGDLMVVPTGNYNVLIMPSDMIEWKASKTPSSIQRGDLMVAPRGYPKELVILPSDMTEPVATAREIPCPWMSTMDGALGAGFYAVDWGSNQWLPLPFVFGPVGPEEYRIVRFK